MSDQTDMNRGFLKDKLGDYRVDPPEKVWTEISGQLGSGRKRRGFYILLLAAAASIALALTLGIHFFGPELSRQLTSREELPSGSSLEPDESGQLHESGKPGESGPQGGLNEQPGGEEASGEAGPSLAMQQPQVKEQVPVSETGSESRMQPGLQTETERTTPREAEITEEEAGGREAEAGPEVTIAPDLEINTESEAVADNLTDQVPEDVEIPLLEQENRRAARWMVGASVSPLYSFRDAEAVSLPSETAESGLLSYSTGVHVSYRRNSRLAFETGIYFNKTGIAIGAPGIQIFSQSYDYLNIGNGSEAAHITTISNTVGNIVAYSGDIYMNGYKVNAENGPDATASVFTGDVRASETGIQQHLDYLEVPFNLRYSVIDRTIELQLVGGMSTNFLVGNYVTMEGESGQEEIGYLSNVNKVNYSGNAGLGMIYHFGNKLSLMVEPRFRYFINSVNDASLPATRPYSLGLYTGLSFTF